MPTPQAALPSTVEGLTSELEADTSLIRFAFGSKVDVRTFRDEKGYVVDVVDPSDGDKPSQAGQTVPQSGLPQAALPQGDSESRRPEAAPATKPAVDGAAAPPAAVAVAAPAKVETPKSAAPAIAAAPAQPPAAAVVSRRARNGSSAGGADATIYNAAGTSQRQQTKRREHS